MLCTTATNTSNTIRTQTGAAVSLIQRSMKPMEEVPLIELGEAELERLVRG